MSSEEEDLDIKNGNEKYFDRASLVKLVCQHSVALEKSQRALTVLSKTRDQNELSEEFSMRSEKVPVAQLNKLVNNMKMIQRRN